MIWLLLVQIFFSYGHSFPIVPFNTTQPSCTQFEKHLASTTSLCRIRFYFPPHLFHKLRWCLLCYRPFPQFLKWEIGTMSVGWRTEIMVLFTPFLHFDWDLLPTHWFTYVNSNSNILSATISVDHAECVCMTLCTHPFEIDKNNLLLQAFCQSCNVGQNIFQNVIYYMLSTVHSNVLHYAQ